MGDCISQETVTPDFMVSKIKDPEKIQFVAKKLPQYFAAFAAHISGIALGAGWFWSATGVPSMARSGEFGELTKSEKSWIVSTPMLGAIMVCPITGYCLNRFGRRSTLMWASLPLAMSWFAIAFSTNLPIILICRVLVGAGCSLSGVVGPVLIAESVEAPFRGMLMCMFEFVIGIGTLYIYIIGSYFNWHIQAGAAGIISIVGFGALFLIPESPYYLMEKNDRQGAVKALCWLRGSPSSDHIADEIAEVCEVVKCRASNSNLSWGELLKDPVVLKPILLSISLMIFFQTSYINVILNTTVEIFESAGSYNEYYSTILIGIIQVIATLVPMTLSDRVGRRILLITSLIMLAISLGVLGLYFNLKKHYDEDFIESLSWIPLAALLGYIISCSIGIVPLSWVLMSEIMPPKAKGLATGLVGVLGRVFGFVVVFTFWDANENLGSDGTYWMISGFNIVAAVFVFFLIPETRNKVWTGSSGDGDKIRFFKLSRMHFNFFESWVGFP